MRLASLVTMLICGCAGSRPAPPVVAADPDPPPQKHTGPAVPLAAWFGTWTDDTGKFERKTRFEKIDGQSFGWRIKTHCTGPVRFREVLRMPAKGDWTFTAEDMPGTTVSDDQTTATTIDYAACKRGWVEHVWSVATDDPAGTYVITVELDGYATQTFRAKFIDP